MLGQKKTKFLLSDTMLTAMRSAAIRRRIRRNNQPACRRGQAYLTLRVLRNSLDEGVDIDTGIGTADEAGNVLSDKEYVYKEDLNVFTTH